MKNLTIGITGGIGAGKSIVSRVLRNNGFVVYDCDYEAKKIMAQDKNVINALINQLGEEIYLSDGILNKKLLTQFLFDNNELRKSVNIIVHQAVLEDIIIKRSRTDGWFFIESAILATGGLIPFCDRIWIVTASEEERIKRVKNRDGINIIEIKKRLAAQENELHLLKDYDINFLENNDNKPLLKKILKMTYILNINQTYSLSC